jgi:cbb3-type cytochrome oxidase subunit 3
MLKEVVSKLDYSVLDQVALVIFALCLGAICLWALTLRRSTVDRFSAIPLSDEVVDPKPLSTSNPSWPA